MSFTWSLRRAKYRRGLVETDIPLPVIKYREHCITCFSCEIFCPEQIVDVHPSVKNRPRPW